MRVYHIRRAVAMLLLATMLLTVFPIAAFAETEPVQSGTEATTAIADPLEDLVEAETGQKTAAPEESLSTDVSTEPEATAQEPDETSDSAVPTEEQTEATAPQDATAPTEIASESTESTTAVDSTEETEETSEEQDAAEAESDSSLVDIVADAITSIFDSLRGESANLTIPYRIYGAGANFGQVLKFWFQYPKNDTGHNVSLEGINGHYINNTVAYCLEPHRGATAGTAFSKLADNRLFWHSRGAEMAGTPVIMRQ